MMCQAESSLDFKWLVSRFLDEGFGVLIKPSRDGVSSFLTVTTKEGLRSKQITRLVIHDFSPSEYAHVYWDMLSTIQKLERR